MLLVAVLQAAAWGPIVPFQSVGRASRGDLSVTPSPRCVQGYLFWRESKSHKDPDYLRRCLSAVFRVSRRSTPIPLWEVEVRGDSPSKPRRQSTKLRDTGICPRRNPCRVGLAPPTRACGALAYGLQTEDPRCVIWAPSSGNKFYLEGGVCGLS